MGRLGLLLGVVGRVRPIPLRLPLPLEPPLVRLSPQINVRDPIGLFPSPGTARNGKSESGMRPRRPTAPFVLGALAFRALYVIVPCLGALAFRAVYAIGSSWEPWRSEFLTSSGALGSRALAVRAFRATESPKHVGSATWSSWEPWRRNCIRHWGVLGREPWRQSCVRQCAVVGPEGPHHHPY